MDASENFPSGLRVMVVDDDPICLLILEKMLCQCLYQVTTCSCATQAYTILQEKKDTFDLVICDVYMPDMDGFKLLELIGLELDLPVIMMSADGDTSLVMKGITHGACDYLLKPIRIEELRNIWQHVVRKKGNLEFNRDSGSFNWDLRKSLGDVQSKDHGLKKRKVKLELSDELEQSYNNLKKARVVWTHELHRKFVVAVNQLGIDKAVPKNILEIMKVRGLTRENVASHLQKYRLGLKRLCGIEVERLPVASFQASENGKFGGKMQVQPGGLKVPILGSGSSIRSNAGVFGRSLNELDKGTLTALAQLQAAQKRQSGVNDKKSCVDYGKCATDDLFPAKSTQVERSLIGLQHMSSMELDFLMQIHQTAAQRQKKETASLDPIDLTRVKSETVAGSDEKMMQQDFREGQKKDLTCNILHEKIEQMTPFSPYVKLEDHGLDFELSELDGGFGEATSPQAVHRWGSINSPEPASSDVSNHPCIESSNYVQLSPHVFSSLLDEFLPP